jgi:hypothetical protein
MILFYFIFRFCYNNEITLFMAHNHHHCGPLLAAWIMIRINDAEGHKQHPQLLVGWKQGAMQTVRGPRHQDDNDNG